jgi:hypothetical protein
MSVVDRHRLGAGPDPSFHFDADPDPDSHQIQNNAYPHVDLTTSFTQVEKLGNIFLLSFLVMPVHNVFHFSSVANLSLFVYCGKHIKISMKKEKNTCVWNRCLAGSGSATLESL